jgi:hypothetical protein
MLASKFNVYLKILYGNLKKLKFQKLRFSIIVIYYFLNIFKIKLFSNLLEKH